jgi:hypothetical protein
VPRPESPNKIECIVGTSSLRAFFPEAGADAKLAARVMAAIDECLGRPESGPLGCFLVKPEALALSKECIADYDLDIIRVLGGDDRSQG